MSTEAGTHLAPATGTGRTSLSVIARSGSINLVGTAAGALLTLGLTAAVARGTSTSVAGAVFATTSLFLVVAAMAEVGSDVSLARFVPRCVTAGRPQEARLLVRAAVLTTGAVGLLLGAVLVLARAPLSAVLSGPALRDDVESAVVVLALAVPLAAGANTLLAATRGLGTVRPTVLVEKLGRGGLQLALVLVAVATGGGVAVLVAAWSAPYVLAAIAARLWYGSLTRSWRSPTADGPPAIRSTLREYAAFTWPRAVSRLCQIIMQRADIVLVAALRSPAEAAVYTVATRFLVVGQLAVQAVQQVLAPQASGLLASGDDREAVRVFQTTTAWTMALTWPMYLWSMGAAPLLLTVLGGEQYRSGVTVVVVLAAAALVASAGGPVDTMLLMAGRSGLSLINNLIGLVLLLGLAVLLVPDWGIDGAAVAWASAIVVRNLLGVAQVRRLLGAFPYTRSTLIVVVSACVSFGLPAVLLRSSGQDGGWLLVAGVLGSLLHLVVLWQARRQLGLAELDAWPKRSRLGGRSTTATRRA